MTNAQKIISSAIQQSTSSDELILIRADSIEPKQIDWLWHNWLPRKMLTLLAGNPGCGKSTISFDFAATVSRGGTWPDASISPSGNVLIWSGEDEIQTTIVPRLRAMNADMTKIHFVAGIKVEGQERPFDPATDMKRLTTAAEMLAPALIVIDPIVAVVLGDSHKNAEVRRGLQPVVDLANSLGCAVLGITHFTKGTAGAVPLERVTGSLAFAALARIVLVAAKDESGEGKSRTFARAKSNVGPDEGGFSYDLKQHVVPNHDKLMASIVEWGIALSESARVLLNDVEHLEHNAQEDKGALTNGITFLRAELSMGPVLTEALKKSATRAGVSWASVRRAKDKIGVMARKDGPDGSWRWHSRQGDLDVQGAQRAQSVEGNSNCDVMQNDQRLLPHLEQLEHDSHP